MEKQFKSKRLIILLIMVLVILVFAAACSSQGNNQENNEDSGSNTTPKTADNNSGNKDSAADEDPHNKLSVSFYDRGIIPKEMGTPEENTWGKWVNENSGLDVTYVSIPRGDSASKFNVLFASNQAPDIIFEYNGVYRQQLFNQKQILPLNDLIEEHSTVYKALLKQFPAMEKMGIREDGQLYDIGRVNYIHSDAAWFIRKDWLDNLGLSVPTTDEELFEVALALAKDDPNNNEMDDTFGLDLGPAMGRGIEHMFQDHWFIVNESNELYRQWDRAEAALTFKKKVYDAGIVDKDFLSDQKGQKAIQNWVTGKSGMIQGRTLQPADFTLFYEPLRKNVPESEVIAIQLPETEFGSFAAPISPAVQPTAVVNVNAEDPIAVIKFIDFMASKSTTHALTYGFENEHYEIGAQGCPVQKDADKFKNEISWNMDFKMLASELLLGTCAFVENIMNPEVPLEKEFIDIAKMNNEANLDPSRPMGEFTHGANNPALPDDMSLINANLKTALSEIFSKAIVSGSSYTVEQAMADAKEAWSSMDGEKLEQWYHDWYQNNKDTAFLTPDLYDFLPPSE